MKNRDLLLAILAGSVGAALLDFKEMMGVCMLIISFYLWPEG